jgi:hypothetical protein
MHPDQQALARLSQALANNPAVNVVVASEPDPEAGVVIQRLNLRQDLAMEFAASAQNSMPVVDDDLVLKRYDPGYKPEAHELSYIELAENERVAEHVRQISQVQQAELFRENDRIVDHLRFYAIVVAHTARQRAVFFRTYNPKKELTLTCPPKSSPAEM